jgi:hypothetical protein
MRKPCSANGDVIAWKLSGQRREKTSGHRSNQSARWLGANGSNRDGRGAGDSSDPRVRAGVGSFRAGDCGVDFLAMVCLLLFVNLTACPRSLSAPATPTM